MSLYASQIIKIVDQKTPKCFCSFPPVPLACLEIAKKPFLGYSLGPHENDAIDPQLGSA
jgi:hypothetical protein